MHSLYLLPEGQRTSLKHDKENKFDFCGIWCAGSAPFSFSVGVGKRLAGSSATVLYTLVVDIKG